VGGIYELRPGVLRIAKCHLNTKCKYRTRQTAKYHLN
jgi:hypothetical protein